MAHLTHEDLAALHHRALTIEEGVLSELGLSTAPRRGASERTRAPGYMRAREQIRQHPAAWARWCQAERLRWQIALTAEPDLHAKTHRYPETVREDLRSGARPYIFTAAVIWNPDRSKFRTLAKWWIQAGINRARSTTASGLTLPGCMNEVRNTLARHGDAGVASVFPATVERAKSFSVVSLDVPKQFGDGSGDTFHNLIGVVEPDPGADIDTARQLEELRAGLDVLRQHSPRAYAVLNRRYGLDGGDEATLKDAGAAIGVSRERARQIHNEGLEFGEAWLDLGPAPPWLRKLMKRGYRPAYRPAHP